MIHIKKLVKIFMIILILVSCNTNMNLTKKKDSTSTIEKKQIELKPEELIYDNNGVYIERYPSGKTKIEGQKNKNKKREGYWVAYFENGLKQSEITYIDGKKHGVQIVYHPNQKPSYVGEWTHDSRSGEWKFYNQAGTLIKKINYNKKN